MVFVYLTYASGYMTIFCDSFFDMKCEYFLPSVVEELLKEKRATVEVMESAEKWYGVTYKEDKKSVMDAISEMKQQGVYPEDLWK